MSETAAHAASDISFLREASARGRSRVLESTQLVSYPAGGVIFNEGDPPEHLFVVAEGEVDIVSTNFAGEEEVQRTLGAGRILGELGILGGHARTAAARAARDTSLWAIEREAFLEVYESEPSVSVTIASAMAAYLLDADVVAEDLLFLNLEGRVAKRLLGFLDADGTGVYPVTATEQMSQQDVATTLQRMARALAEPEQVYTHLERLALLSGGSRRAVAGILVEMQRRGILISTEGNLIVIDTPALEELARPR